MRPSIVVGEFATGRTTKFSGFYLTLRAAEAVARMHRESEGGIERVRLRGRPKGRQNIVPVDYVADMISAIAKDSAHHGRVHHLVHPSPPRNDAIQRAVEEHLKWQCTEFASENFAGERNQLERVFDRLASTVEPYILDTPQFDRRHAEAVEQVAGIACPAFDHESLLRLCRFATSNRWRSDRPPEAQSEVESDPAEYFDHFLPENILRSRVAEMNSLCATVRFVLTDMPDGQWVCRFDRGRLAQVHRGRNGLKEDFGYRTTRDVFCRAVAGTIDPHQAFLARQADVFGDIERALKMAMVLREFNRECPFPPEAPRAERAGDIMQERVWIDGPRRLAGELAYPMGDDPVGAALLVNPHPYMGGSMHNNVIAHLHAALATAALVTLRFDYSGVGETRAARSTSRSRWPSSGRRITRRWMP